MTTRSSSSRTTTGSVRTSNRPADIDAKFTNCTTMRSSRADAFSISLANRRTSAVLMSRVRMIWL